MPITSSDLKVKLSITTGSAGDSTAQTDPNSSLGKYISTSELVDDTLHNLFDAISGDENAAGDVEYRCLFIHNAHPTLTLQGATLWLTEQTAGGADAAIAVDSTAASPVDDTTPQALEVPDESTAPEGLSFSAPTSKETGLSLGDIPAGYCRAFWIRRTATDSAAIDDDGVTFRIEGDTEAGE